MPLTQTMRQVNNRLTNHLLVHHPTHLNDAQEKKWTSLSMKLVLVKVNLTKVRKMKMTHFLTFLRENILAVSTPYACKPTSPAQSSSSLWTTKSVIWFWRTRTWARNKFGRCSRRSVSLNLRLKLLTYRARFSATCAALSALSLHLANITTPYPGLSQKHPNTFSLALSRTPYRQAKEKIWCA